MFISAIENRNAAETSVPSTPPMVLKASTWVLNSVAVTAIATDAATTIVEWPNEKKKPTVTGRLPSCISLRVTLSMAAMWSASTA